MPTLADLRVRFTPPTRLPAAQLGTDETLVVDSRSKMSPAQMVEQKLRLALLAGRGLKGVLAARRRKPQSP